MKAIVYQGPKAISVENRETPTLSEGYALIKVSHAGICGTDLNIYGGYHPRAKAPLVLGHEFSGLIAAGHPALPEGTPVTVNPLIMCGECIPCKTGQSHVCESLKLIGIDSDGGMAEYIKVPIKSIVPLPEGMPLSAGALVEPVAVAVHAARQGGYVPGDNVVIYGAGTIGLCVARTVRSFGAGHVCIVETNEARLKLAGELGFTTINPAKADVKETILSYTDQAGADFVFDCAGHPVVASQLTDVVKVRGNIIVVAAYKNPAEINLLQGMFKELSIRFVRVYTEKDFKIAAELLSEVQDFQKIITHLLSPEEAERGFELLTAPHTEAVKVMYQFLD